MSVVITDDMVERLALFYQRKRIHPPPQTILQIPINVRQRAMDEAREALYFAFGQGEKHDQ